MAVFCPKPCGRLATAAVFIAVGVVQLLVGVILLRSKFADLLSGADFLTSATNLFVGCLYGIASSVWQNDAKKTTTKRTARKNTLAALLVTVIAVNTTAVIILIMSEGNELLSLPYFEDRSGHSSVAFAKEVFACAYVASVCSPIVCVVIALVALSGNCFKTYSTAKSTKQDNSDDKVRNPFGWVYDEKSSQKTSSDTQASSSENSVSSASSDFSSLKGKSMLNAKNGKGVLHEWQQKRARILENSEMSHKYSSNALFRKENTVDITPERLISRTGDSSMVKHTTKNVTIHENRTSDIIHSTSKDNIMPNTNIHHSSVFRDYKKVRSDSYAKAILDENGINYETLLKKSESMANKSIDTEESKNYSRRQSSKCIGTVQYSLDETLPKISYVSANESLVKNSDARLAEVEDPEITRLKLQTLQELKRRVNKAHPGSKFKSYSCKERNSTDPKTREFFFFKSSLQKQSPRETVLHNSQTEETLSPGEVFEPREESVTTTKYFANMKNASPTSVSKNFSAVYPKPLDLRTIKKVSNEVKEIVSHARPKSSYSPTEVSTKCKFQTSRDKEAETDYPDVTSSKLQNTTPKRVASLASIAEVPSEEVNFALLERYSDSPSHVQNRSTRDESSRNVDENSNIRVYSSPNRKYSRSPALIKSRSFSPKSILKKMWSQVPEVSVADLIVDEDSLIGLSDEELLARTLRIRDLRKDVEERIKRENKIKMEDLRAHVEY
ncbi:hypothetical protein JTE90_013264 [Oedothorax gibbosus]|uniref:Uncharacterized protein n=1 Tax=Oedothorax gibbosus TaxID=931172 RepID=A0AAV6VDA1_9ARAC|nr:hypothetical protein JTE90_013264 [Oedothorax gibbosus]